MYLRKSRADIEAEKLGEGETLKRHKDILTKLAANKNEVVILGAFGCGAFMNNPEVVARAYKKLMEEFKYTFETIEFAIYCSPRDDSNFRIFNVIMNGK